MSNLTRSRNQLWEDLLTNLGGSGSALTMSEEELIAAVRNTYGGSVSAKTLSRPKLLASLVNAAGGTASAATDSEDEMLARLATTLGASNWSASTKSGLQSLAEAVSLSSGGGGGGETYTALGVNFIGAPDQGTQLDGPVGISDSASITISFLTKFTTDGLNAFQVAFGGPSNIQITPGNSATTDIGANFSGSTGEFFSFGSADGVFTANAWHHVFVACDVNAADGLKTRHLWLDGVNIVDPENDSDGFGAFLLLLNTTPSLIVPDFAGEPYDQEYADVQVWFGQCIDPSTHIDKFFAAGKPVDPAVPAVAFGTQSVLWQRTTSDPNEFAVNKGGAGATTLSAGTLENSSTSPSG